MRHGRYKLKRFLIIIIFSLSSINLYAQEKILLTLEKCTRLALERSEAVLQAQESLRRAEANLRAAQSDLNPQVGLTGFYNQRKDGERDSLKDYSAALSFSQLLLRFGEVPPYLDRAQEEVRVALLDYERAKKEAVYLVRRIFYNILLTTEEIAERRKLEAAIKQKLERVKKRKNAGILLQINVLNTELELAEQQREINELERRLDLEKTELVQTTGEDELKEVEIVGGIQETDYTLAEATELSLKNSLDLELLRGDTRRQERLVKETLFYRIPELQASLRYKDASLTLKRQNRSWDAILSYDAPILKKERTGAEEELIFEGSYSNENFDFTEREGWELRFNLDLSLFDGFFTKEIKASEQAELDRLKLKLKELEKSIILEVRRAFRNVASAKERMEIEGKVLSIHQENLRLIETLLETGQESAQYRALTFDDLIKARAAYTEAQRIYFQSKRNYIQAREALRKAMGVID